MRQPLRTRRAFFADPAGAATSAWRARAGVWPAKAAWLAQDAGRALLSVTTGTEPPGCRSSPVPARLDSPDRLSCVYGGLAHRLSRFFPSEAVAWLVHRLDCTFKELLGFPAIRIAPYAQFGDVLGVT